MIDRSTRALAALLLAAGTANAQVVINEVFENGKDGTDEQFEFIELYGCPGMPLDGYAIALFKGGLDEDGNDIPDGSGADNVSEIDEAFSLDGLTIGSNGFLVLYNDTDANNLIPTLIPVETNAINWELAHIPTTDTAGNLNGTGSSTYILVRARANPNNFRKEIIPDADFDGKIDFGNEPGPYYGAGAPVACAPFQRVDEFAWSNGGGKEYVRDSDYEISETPGFNPDAVSRVAYYIANPNLGHRTRDDGLGGFEIVATRTADESFVYGEIPISSLINPPSLEYSTLTDADGNIESKGPTSQSFLPYDGSCDPEPFNPGPNPACMPTPGGQYRFDDIQLTGFSVTPGDFNDGAGISQFRFECAQGGSKVNGQVWLRADFNQDGVVDCDDIELIASRVGATLDDTEPGIDPQGMPFTNYKWQNADFQVMLMMLNMDKTDDGGSNAAAVTQADVDATIAAVPVPLCIGDLDNDDDTDVFDFNIFAPNFGASGEDCGFPGDFDYDGDVDVFDFNIFAPDFGCDEN